MMNVASAGGDRNHKLLRLSVFPVGYPNFIKIKHQISWAALKCLVHTAYLRIVSTGKIRGTCKRGSSCGEFFVSISSAE
jgi:hypothetical protein